VSPKRAFDLLSKAVGHVLAQVICWAILAAALGLFSRAFVLIDRVTRFKLDPVKFFMVVAGAAIAFYIWRSLATADLDE
jgi:hypothetical protein